MCVCVSVCMRSKHCLAVQAALKQASSAAGALLKQHAAREHAAHTDVKVSYNRRCSVLSTFLSLQMIKVV